MVGKVFSWRGFGVYIRSGDRDVGHNLPHCHLQWSAGSVPVSLFAWEILAGRAMLPNGVIPRQLLKELEDHADELADEWERLNPSR